MDNILKGSLSAFFIIFFTFIGIGIINISLTGRNADDFAENCVSVIESSNYSNSSIQTCKDTAEANNYTLTVNTGGRDKSGLMKAGTLTVEYSLRMPLIGLETTRTVTKVLK